MQDKTLDTAKTRLFLWTSAGIHIIEMKQDTLPVSYEYEGLCLPHLALGMLGLQQHPQDNVIIPPVMTDHLAVEIHLD